MTEKEKVLIVQNMCDLKRKSCSINQQLDSIINHLSKENNKVYVAYDYSELTKEPEIIKVFKDHETAVNFVKYSGYWMKEMEVE